MPPASPATSSASSEGSSFEINDLLGEVDAVLKDYGETSVVQAEISSQTATPESGPKADEVQTREAVGCILSLMPKILTGLTSVEVTAIYDAVDVLESLDVLSTDEFYMLRRLVDRTSTMPKLKAAFAKAKAELKYGHDQLSAALGKQAKAREARLQHQTKRNKLDQDHQAAVAEVKRLEDLLNKAKEHEQLIQAEITAINEQAASNQEEERAAVKLLAGKRAKLEHLAVQQKKARKEEAKLIKEVNNEIAAISISLQGVLSQF